MEAGKTLERGLAEWRATPSALLLDVRTREEYEGGHIAGSVNLPLSEIGEIQRIAQDRKKPIFVYCRSGMRAMKAVSILRGMGYHGAVCIGGILGQNIRP